MTASPVFTTVLDHDPYTQVQCAYLVCEHDKALPAPYQEGMAAAQGSREGVSMTIYHAPCGHSPQLVWIDGLVEKVNEFGHKALQAL